MIVDEDLLGGPFHLGRTEFDGDPGHHSGLGFGDEVGLGIGRSLSDRGSEVTHDGDRLQFLVCHGGQLSFKSRVEALAPAVGICTVDDQQVGRARLGIHAHLYDIDGRQCCVKQYDQPQHLGNCGSLGHVIDLSDLASLALAVCVRSGTTVAPTSLSAWKHTAHLRKSTVFFKVLTMLPVKSFQNTPLTSGDPNHRCLCGTTRSALPTQKEGFVRCSPERQPDENDWLGAVYFQGKREVSRSIFPQVLSSPSGSLFRT